ncbi:MAG: tetratricopeptide repeat protein [Acidobacteriota bacterium]|nr:tetratricopeptide repeat protein [Acidobacteriota bacterium]
MRVVLMILLLLTGGLARAEDRAPADAQERQALEALDSGRFVRARHLAEQLLAKNEGDPVAHFVLGAALHEGEGNMPLALNHYRRAEELLQDESGDPLPGQESWHHRILLAKLLVLSDLGHYEELLALTARLRRLYEHDFYSVDIWPLMKLGRIDEARRAAALALGTGDEIEEVIARNGLCALDGYEACRQMLEAVEKAQLPPAVALRNLAVAAATFGRYDQAERLLLEATTHPDPDINPWRDLAAALARPRTAGRGPRRAQEDDRVRPWRLPPAKNGRRGPRVTVSGVACSRSCLPNRPALRREPSTGRTADSHWSGSARSTARGAPALRATLLTLAEHPTSVPPEPLAALWRPALAAMMLRVRARGSVGACSRCWPGEVCAPERRCGLSRPSELSASGWLVLSTVWP